MRKALELRETRETSVRVELDLDGGAVEISTGIGFFDHMLTAFAVHGGFGLTLQTKGDLAVDCHHTVEDTGIVLGTAFAKALGGFSGIRRYGSFYIPMDEALVLAVCDLSGRAYLAFRAEFPEERIGEYDSCMTEEFLRAFAVHAGITLHIKEEYGKNSHHITEAIYKALGHALREAVSRSGGENPLSTKGVL